jgi:hypothetical protein
LIAEALSLGEHAQSSNATVTHRLQLYMLRREQGRLAEVEDLIRRTAAQYPGKSAWRCVMANLTATLGIEAESREHLSGLAQDDFAEVVFDDSWLVRHGVRGGDGRCARRHAAGRGALPTPTPLRRSGGRDLS